MAHGTRDSLEIGPFSPFVNGAYEAKELEPLEDSQSVLYDDANTLFNEQKSHKEAHPLHVRAATTQPKSKANANKSMHSNMSSTQYLQKSHETMLQKSHET